MGAVCTGPWLHSLCIVSAAHGILHCQIRCSWSHVRAYSFWLFPRQVHVCFSPHYELGIWCFLQLMVGGHVSIAGCSGQALAGSSIMVGNVPHVSNQECTCVQNCLAWPVRKPLIRCLYLGYHYTNYHILDSLCGCYLSLFLVNDDISSCYSLSNKMQGIFRVFMARITSHFQLN